MPSKRSLGDWRTSTSTHAETLSIGEHGEEPVLVAVELDLLEHATMQGASAATEVVVLQARDPRQQAVEYGAPHPLERAARPGPAPTDRRGRLESSAGDELADLGRLDLVVGGQGDDDLPRGVLEACHERSGFAEGAGQADHGEALARRRAASAVRRRNRSRGPSRTKIISYGWRSASRPALYSACNVGGVGVARSRPERSRTVRCPTCAQACVDTSDSPPQRCGWPDLAGQAREVALAHVAELVDEFAQDSAADEDEGAHQQDDTGAGDRQGQRAGAGPAPQRMADRQQAQQCQRRRRAARTSAAGAT